MRKKGLAKQQPVLRTFCNASFMLCKMLDNCMEMVNNYQTHTLHNVQHGSTRLVTQLSSQQSTKKQTNSERCETPRVVKRFPFVVDVSKPLWVGTQ
jgi:hypothetical protein